MILQLPELFSMKQIKEVIKLNIWIHSVFEAPGIMNLVINKNVGLMAISCKLWYWKMPRGPGEVLLRKDGYWEKPRGGRLGDKEIIWLQSHQALYYSCQNAKKRNYNNDNNNKILFNETIALHKYNTRRDMMEMLQW